MTAAGWLSSAADVIALDRSERMVARAGDAWDPLPERGFLVETARTPA